MLVNLLISLLFATSVVLIAYRIIKPVLRNKMLNNPAFVRWVSIDNRSKALLVTAPFPWYCTREDFTRYANFARIKDPTIDVIGHFTKYGTYGLSCHWAYNEEELKSYDLTRMQGKYCRVAFKSCAVIEPGTPIDAVIDLLKKART